MAFATPPSIAGHADVVGKKEGEGPLSASFDFINQDDTFGEASFEKAESAMQRMALQNALDKAKQSAATLDYIFAGDLLNQCIASSFAVRGQDIPFFGLYGACSTMAESPPLAPVLDGGFGRCAACLFPHLLRGAAVPHPAGVRRQRPPGPVDGDRLGGGGAAREGDGPMSPTHRGQDCGQGISDATTWAPPCSGGLLEPARHFPTPAARRFLCLIVTGDWQPGQRDRPGPLPEGRVDLTNYDDCGCLIFAPSPKHHCGSSGCGCSAAVLTGNLHNGMREGNGRTSLCGIGALLSPPPP